MLNIQIGPGKLALGLLVPCVSRAGIDVCLVGPADYEVPERKHYKFASPDPEIGLVIRSVAAASNAATVDELDEAIRSRLASPEPVLVTCALAGHIGERVTFIDQIVALRPAEAETMLVVCENDPGPEYDELARRHGELVAFCRSVVNRVCVSPTGDGARDRKGLRIVSAYGAGEWVIAHPAPDASALSQALATVAEVRIVAPSQLPAFADRKRWMVNGLHLVLGLIARETGFDKLDAVAESERFKEISGRLLAAFELALEHAHPDLPEESAYGQDCVDVFCEAKDTTARVLGSLVRQDLRPLIERVDRRVCDAAREVHAAGGSVEPFLDVIQLLLRVIENPRLFYDSREEPLVLDAAIDAEVLDAFAAALEPWAGPEADDLVWQLEEILAAQRDRLRNRGPA